MWADICVLAMCGPTQGVARLVRGGWRAMCSSCGWPLWFGLNSAQLGIGLSPKLARDLCMGWCAWDTTPPPQAWHTPCGPIRRKSSALGMT